MIRRRRSRREGNIRAYAASVAPRARRVARLAHSRPNRNDVRHLQTQRPESAEETRPWSERLAAGLARSREKLAGALGGVFTRRKLDAETLEELETALITADVGIAATQHLLDDLSRAMEARRRRRRPENAAQGRAGRPPSAARAAAVGRRGAAVRDHAGGGQRRGQDDLDRQARAGYFQAQGHSVLLAAGDTFRAAAREQLAVWGERNGVTVISQAGGDPGAVMFDAIGAATARGIDVVLADTAGRLPTQLQLMEEIRKVQRVIRKADPERPARDAAGARRQYRPERAGAGEGLRRRARTDRPRPDQARRQRQGRRGRGDRQGAADPAAVHRRRRRASTTSSPSSRRSSSTRWSTERRAVIA